MIHKQNVSGDFIKNNIAGPLWDNLKLPQNYPSICKFNAMENLKVGDIVLLRTLFFSFGFGILKLFLTGRNPFNICPYNRKEFVTSLHRPLQHQ